jgi:hypothetical protein
MDGFDPSSGVAALGYTLQLPVKEKFLSTEQELKDQIAILLGGRVAEEVACGNISSGATARSRWRPRNVPPPWRSAIHVEALPVPVHNEEHAPRSSGLARESPGPQQHRCAQTPCRT